MQEAKTNFKQFMAVFDRVFYCSLGISRGSNLSPLLFILFINDVIKVVSPDMPLEYYSLE